jgi:hypothetical protein
VGKSSFQILLTIIFHSFLSGLPFCQNVNFLIPISGSDRTSIGSIQLTPIGDFGLTRKARKDVPEHLHAGIDIKRPSNNYFDEPILPIAPGVVISMRNDGYPTLKLSSSTDLMMANCGQPMNMSLEFGSPWVTASILRSRLLVS